MFFPKSIFSVEVLFRVPSPWPRIAIALLDIGLLDVQTVLYYIIHYDLVYNHTCEWELRKIVSEIPSFLNLNPSVLADILDCGLARIHKILFVSKWGLIVIALNRG